MVDVNQAPLSTPDLIYIALLVRQLVAQAGFDEDKRRRRTYEDRPLSSFGGYFFCQSTFGTTPNMAPPSNSKEPPFSQAS